MTLFHGARTFGRYGGTRVSGEFVNQALALFRQGVGASDARQILRLTGFRFRNQAITDFWREQRHLQQAGRALRFLREDFKPGPRTLTRVNRFFARRYQFSGVVRVTDPAMGVEREFNVSFGSDRLPTRAEIRERFEAIMERAMDTGQRGGYFGEIGEILDVEITAAMEGMQ